MKKGESPRTVGIVADDYKLEKFKQELAANGFNDFTVHRFTKNVSTIKVQLKDIKDVRALGNICRLVELHFNHSNYLYSLGRAL
jgi:hypothetical protein